MMGVSIRRHSAWVLNASTTSGETFCLRPGNKGVRVEGDARSGEVNVRFWDRWASSLLKSIRLVKASLPKTRSSRITRQSEQLVGRWHAVTVAEGVYILWAWMRSRTLLWAVAVKFTQTLVIRWIAERDPGRSEVPPMYSHLPSN
ncbi:hypothetical protein EYF80_006057 [Liparis tanakae]|uniref:Uncharacterized protein n=1 Tax=Liparis tanakae TaxID=230148 RepID=A0A4Z2J006_9TELE|nr:hypothetical protein EYF80_006057 [Liparis tanakae]